MSREPPHFIHSSSSSVHSVAGNNICYRGNMEGLKVLIAAIEKMPNLTSLKCASRVCPGLPCDIRLRHTGRRMHLHWVANCSPLPLAASI